MAFSFVNGLSPLLSILCRGPPIVYGDVCVFLYGIKNTPADAVFLYSISSYLGTTRIVVHGDIVFAADTYSPKSI